MLALLTEAAHTRHRSRFDRFDTARHDLTWVLLGADGSLAPAENRPVGEPLDLDVAWLSSDVFFGNQLARFFELLDGSPSLRWLQSAAAGTDIPGFAELAARGVRICNAHVTSSPIAEFVMRAVLDHFQGADGWRRAQARAQWAHHDFREVQGSTFCIIGLGSIGTEVARRARAFGARVVGVRRTPTGDEVADRVVTPDRLADVVGSADVVVIAAPATPETRHLVDETFLRRMAPGSMLVNVARGSLVDDEALLAALDRGIPELAVLDVFGTEPLPADSRYWDHPRVVVTPHNAAAGSRRWDRAAALFLDNLQRLLDGEPLVDEILRFDQGTTALPHLRAHADPPSAQGGNR